MTATDGGSGRHRGEGVVAPVTAEEVTDAMTPREAFSSSSSSSSSDAAAAANKAAGLENAATKALFAGGRDPSDGQLRSVVLEELKRQFVS